MEEQTSRPTENPMQPASHHCSPTRMASLHNQHWLVSGNSGGWGALTCPRDGVDGGPVSSCTTAAAASRCVSVRVTVLGVRMINLLELNASLRGTV